MPVYIKMISNRPFSMKNFKNVQYFWENFIENVILEILDIEYRTSYQPIKASVFKFLFIVSSLNFWSFLVEIEQTIFVNFDQFWTIRFFVVQIENEWNFSTRKAKFLVLKLIEIKKNITWFCLVVSDWLKSFWTFFKPTKIGVKSKIFSNYKNSCVSVRKNFWAKKGHFCRLENSPLN